MDYYNTTQIHEIIKQAFEGDENARTIINAITVPFAVAHDYSKMILVQEKHASINENGMVKVLNMPPKKGSVRKHVADIYQCDKDGSSWSSVPIPFKFVVQEVKYSDGAFSFISIDNQTVLGTPTQINRAMFEVTFAMNGVSEIDIEKSFFSIPSTVVNSRSSRKTITENPPIKDNIIGEITFDEDLQWFETKYKANGCSFELYINTDSRNEAISLLPTVRDVISGLEVIDHKAREFACEELLELKNDSWLDEDEELITKEEFASKMSIDTISFQEDGEIEIWYNDGDLFWGHSITVYINNGEPKRAEING